jgi:hypothetical protein
LDYRFETSDRTIVISGDTSPTDTVVENCNGCDVLIHEVYTLAGYAKTPPDFRQVRLVYHTSSKQLAEIATKAKPKLLILHHQSTEADLLNEMREFYQGNVVSGHDLDFQEPEPVYSRALGKRQEPSFSGKYSLYHVTGNAMDGHGEARGCFPDASRRLGVQLKLNARIIARLPLRTTSSISTTGCRASAYGAEAAGSHGLFSTGRAMGKGA